jgi:E3 ubiquitin-protein ligase SIAH1
MSTQSLSKDVLDELECPVCMEYMLPPITLCGNGHNICSSCKQKIQKCPTCREPLSETRNKALEKLALKVECPCRNKQHGCTLTFPIALIGEHHGICEYNPFVCPLEYRIKCNWTGLLTEIEDHVLGKHRGLVRHVLGATKLTLKKLDKMLCIDILFSSDNLFFEVIEVIEDAFYYVVQYIGPEKEASNFNYKFVLGNKADEISVCSAASSYSVEVHEVYSTGKCVKLFYDTIERFLDKDKNLQFCIEIFKVKDAHT